LNREQAIIDDAGEALGRLGAEYDMLAAVSDTSAAIEDAQIEAKKAADTRADAEGRVNDLTRRSADLLARRDSAQRELSRAQTRSESLDRELAQAKDGLERLLAGRSEAGNQNLFEAALGDHAKALETARQTETNLQDAKTDAETADRAARDVMSEKKQAVSELRRRSVGTGRMLRMRLCQTVLPHCQISSKRRPHSQQARAAKQACGLNRRN